VRGVVFGVVLFLAFLALGAAVAPHLPGTLDRGELGTFGRDVQLATVGRAAGQFPVYATLCALVLGFGLVRRAYLGAALWLIGLMLVVWKTSDAFKEVFHRARPDQWIGVHESTAGYPSGHATLSLAFYGFLAGVLLRSRLPAGVRVAGTVVAVALVAAIGWSRLALGAHFPSDVLGGYLLGGAGLCWALAGYDRTRERAPEPVGSRFRGRYTR
jgi:membrane-associated phospholipid phosphatase